MRAGVLVGHCCGCWVERCGSWDFRLYLERVSSFEDVWALIGALTIRIGFWGAIILALYRGHKGILVVNIPTQIIVIFKRSGADMKAVSYLGALPPTWPALPCVTMTARPSPPPSPPPPPRPPAKILGTLSNPKEPKRENVIQNPKPKALKPFEGQPKTLLNAIKPHVERVVRQAILLSELAKGALKTGMEFGGGGGVALVTFVWPIS